MLGDPVWPVRATPLGMSTPIPQPSDAAVAAELAQIAERLAALASTEPPSGIGAELVSIRAQLRRLAADNAEVGARLADIFGIEPKQ